MVGCKKLVKKPKWANLGADIYWIEALKQRLKVKGLRQSPWITPRPTLMEGVRNELVTIDVQKLDNNFFKLHFHIYKLNIQIQISLMLGNLHSVGLSTDISIHQANKQRETVSMTEGPG